MAPAANYPPQIYRKNSDLEVERINVLKERHIGLTTKLEMIRLEKMKLVERATEVLLESGWF